MYKINDEDEIPEELKGVKAFEMTPRRKYLIYMSEDKEVKEEKD